MNLNYSSRTMKFFAIILAVSILTSIFSITTFVPASAEDDVPLIVSLGDSYSSGEGIEKFYNQDKSIEEKIKDIENDNYDWVCHRSENSWPGQIQIDGADHPLSYYRGSKWFFVASSGAETKHLEKEKQTKTIKNDKIESGEYSTSVPTQLSIFQDGTVDGDAVDYITMTMGGNDADFSHVVEDAVKQTLADKVKSKLMWWDPLDIFVDINILPRKLNQVWADFYREGGIRTNLFESYHSVAEAAPNATIVIAGYPTLLGSTLNMGFTQKSANWVNDSVSQFNKEIQTLVNACTAEKMKICFVPVEQEFHGHEAYTIKSYINPIRTPRKQDIDQTALASAYSIHPNKKGAKIYADLVSAKINELEQKKANGESVVPTAQTSQEIDTVLVLDSSGSMSGDPIEQTKNASRKFVKEVAKNDASVGIVTYDDEAFKIADFNKDPNVLIPIIDEINDGGGTNMDAGLQKAVGMLQESTAKKKIIVLMSDGEPNIGREGDELIDFAAQIKDSGIHLYTLGFNESADGQRLLEAMASQGCHYEVSDANSLVFFFGDIADQISGQNFIFIRIACPVDVKVEYNGEVLSSLEESSNQRTSFGSMTFEENTEEESSEDAGDNRIKVLRLKEGVPYDIKIDGNGSGKMDYTIGFMDDFGKYSDMRSFSNIAIGKSTSIDTVAEVSDATTLKVDEDGDGRYDLTYKAKANSEAELVDNTWIIYTIVAVGGVIVLIILILLIKNTLKRAKAKAALKHPPVYCGRCGTRVSSHARICPKCGNRIQK